MSVSAHVNSQPHACALALTPYLRPVNTRPSPFPYLLHVLAQDQPLPQGALLRFRGASSARRSHYHWGVACRPSCRRDVDTWITRVCPTCTYLVLRIKKSSRSYGPPNPRLAPLRSLHLSPFPRATCPSSHKCALVIHGPLTCQLSLRS